MRRTHAPDTRAGHTRRTHGHPSRRCRAIPSLPVPLSRRFALFRRRAVSRCSVVAPFRGVPSSRRSVVAPFRRRAGHTHRTHAPNTHTGHTRQFRCRVVVAPFRCRAVPLSRRSVVVPDTHTGHTRQFHRRAVSRRSVVAPFRCRAVPSSRRTHAPDTRAGHTHRTHAPDTRTGHARRTHAHPVAASSRRSVVAQFRRCAVSRNSVVAPFRAVPLLRRSVVAPDLRAGHTRCYSAGYVVAVPSSRRSVVVPFCRRAVPSSLRTYAPDTRAVIARVPSSPFRRRVVRCRAGHTRRKHAPDTCTGHMRRTHTPDTRPPRRASSRRSVVAPFRCCAVPLLRRSVIAPDLRAGHMRCYSAGSVVAIPSSRRSVVAPFRRHAGST